MKKRIAVIGIGNPFQGDDAIGIHLIEQLKKLEWVQESAIEVIDGGTGGINLFHIASIYEIVIFVDAIEFQGKPGERIFRSTKEIVKSNKKKERLSTHTSDLFTVIQMISHMHESPPHMFVFGVQPKTIALQESFSKEVESCIPHLVQQLSKDIKQILKTYN